MYSIHTSPQSRNKVYLSIIQYSSYFDTIDTNINLCAFDGYDIDPDEFKNLDNLINSLQIDDELKYIFNIISFINVEKKNNCYKITNKSHKIISTLNFETEGDFYWHKKIKLNYKDMGLEILDKTFAFEEIADIFFNIFKKKFTSITTKNLGGGEKVIPSLARLIVIYKIKSLFPTEQKLCPHY